MQHEDRMNEESYQIARAEDAAWKRARSAGSPDVSAPPVLKPTPKEYFIDHGSDREMRWDALYSRGYLVPNELFYVRNHCPTPIIDSAGWRLSVDGAALDRTLDLTYDELLGLPSISVIRAIECAGNGRSFLGEAYQRKIKGTQWKLGAIGVAEWTGVPLREVLDRAGIQPAAKDVMIEGLDALKVNRSIPIEKAMEADTLLVYAMNGQVLPPDHGYPVRLLVPGWSGISSIKWVGHIEVAPEPLYSVWNTREYVLQGPGYEPQGPALGPPLTELNVKSAFELPWDGVLPPGRRLLRGRSWSGRGAVQSVEVSFDRGASWQPARLRPPNLAGAWVRWDLEWDARPGRHALMARATDDRGAAQPAQARFNEGGYLYNGIIEHPGTVTAGG